MSTQSKLPDPVADKSGFLRMYMSNHPDTLVAYAKWYGKVQEQVTSAEMTAIDSRSMTLTCTLKNGSKKTVHVPIEPPLKGYDDVKPRLLEMKALAQEGLGMIKSPRITTFALPSDTWKSALFVSTLAYLALSPPGSLSPFFYISNFAQQYLGHGILKGVLYGIAGIHLLEGLYTFSLCRKHQTGFGVGALYVVSTLLFGFPIWRSMLKNIQTARIDSVMKVE